jgi:hypothetical protein
MVIRFGLIPGAVDRGRCGCSHGGPTKFVSWQPRRDSDPDLSACKSERPTVRLRGSFEADCEAAFSQIQPREAASPFSSPPLLGQRAGGSNPPSHNPFSNGDLDNIHIIIQRKRYFGYYPKILLLRG